MALAMSEVLLTTPMAIFTIWLNATVSPLGPWVSWQDTHFNYSRIELFPSILWRSNRVFVMTMEFTRWVPPLCAFVFFAFFGFASEARRNYTKLYSWIIRQPVIGSGKQFLSTKDKAASLGFVNRLAIFLHVFLSKFY
jgi:pheromone a factor receptor